MLSLKLGAAPSLELCDSKKLLEMFEPKQAAKAEDRAKAPKSEASYKPARPPEAKPRQSEQVRQSKSAEGNAKPGMSRSSSEGALGKPRSAAPRQRVDAALPRLPSASQVGAPPGVSTAFLVSFMVDYRPPKDAPPERRSTRAMAAALRRRRQEEGDEAVLGAVTLAQNEELHPLTGKPVAGSAQTHVAHAWEADFSELVDCLVKDAGCDFDRRYHLDVFGADHLPAPDSSPRTESAPSKPAAQSQASGDDPVASVQGIITGAKEVLLVLDTEVKALGRLWVLFEAMMALPTGKLRIRSADPKGFGSSEADVLKWEERIDAVDWSLADCTRKTDERRLKSFEQRVWETHGSGTEKLLAQLKVLLRREVYGQLILGAVEAGDKKAVEALLKRGASAEQRDADGNSLEDLASFYKHQAIEDLLFERRMGGMTHKSLSSFFSSDELLANSGGADPGVLAPFMTETFYDGNLSLDAEEGEDWHFHAGFEDHPSNQSTASHTPGSSQFDWSTPSGLAD